MCGKSAAEKYSLFGKVEFIKQMKPCRNNIDLKATFGMVQIKFYTKFAIQQYSKGPVHSFDRSYPDGSV